MSVEMLIRLTEVQRRARNVQLAAGDDSVRHDRNSHPEICVLGVGTLQVVLEFLWAKATIYGEIRYDTIGFLHQKYAFLGLVHVFEFLCGKMFASRAHHMLGIN